MRASEELYGISLSLFDTVEECTFYCISVVLKSPVRETIEIPAHGRPYFVAWWIFSFIATAAYTGNLIAFITSPGLKAPINTPEEIIKSQIPIKQYNYNGATNVAFEASQDPILKKIWKDTIFITNYSKILEEVIESKAIFIEFFSYLEPKIKSVYSTSSGLPEMHLGKGKLFQFNFGWAIQPGAVFKEAIDESITKFIEAGLVTKWRDVAIEEMRKKSTRDAEIKERKVDSPLSMKNLQGVFFVWLAGLGVAFLVLFVEFLIKHN